MANRLLSKTDQIIKVSKLAPGWGAKMFLVLWALWMAVRHRLGVRQERAGKLRLRYGEKDFFFFSSYSTDLSVMDEVFVKEMYILPESVSPRVIFDLGSNTGVTSTFFRLRYPEAQIYAFEPDPQVFKALERNAAGGSIHPYNLAVTGTDRLIDFYIHPKSPIVSSVTRRFAEQEKVRVTGKSLHTLMRELGAEEIDILKFDVEGAEGEIFSSCDTSKINWLVGELHTDLARLSLEEFRALFPYHDLEAEIISPTRYTIVAHRKHGST